MKNRALSPVLLFVRTEEPSPCPYFPLRSPKKNSARVPGPV